MSDHKMYSLEYEIDSLSLEEELSVHKIVTDAMKGKKALSDAKTGVRLLDE